MAGTKQKEKRSGRRARLLLGVLVLLVAGGAGGLGWHWLAHLPCREIRVTGLQHAEREALLQIARIDTGMVLFDLEPRLVADRLQRHPWVRAASVTRLPTGTLSIDVRERLPALLVLDRDGYPVRYLDRDGYLMPLVKGAYYDVPLLHGLPGPYETPQPVARPALLALLEGLPDLDPEVDALVSAFELRDGEVWLHTTPAGPRGAIPVRLGRSGFPEKLRRLRVFWEEAVLTRPDVAFAYIDLRFDSQIVTREVARDGTAGTS